MTYTNTGLVSAELGGLELSSTSTPSDSEVFEWIRQASGEIDFRTNQSYGQTIVINETYDYEGDSYVLRLKDSPIISVSSFEYNSNHAGETPNWVSKTVDTDFMVYGDFGEIEFIPTKFNPLPGKNRFRITYIHGYSTTPYIVRRLATLMVAKRVIDTVVMSQARIPGGSVSVGTIRVTDPGNFSPGVSRSIREEIELLFKQLGEGFKTYNPVRAYNA